MGLIRTQKLAALDLHDWQCVFMTLSIIQSTLDIVQVHDFGMCSTMGHLIDFLKPFHLTVTVEMILAQEELRQIGSCK